MTCQHDIYLNMADELHERPPCPTGTLQKGQDKPTEL